MSTDSLRRLAKEAVAAFKALSPAEQAEHLRRQRHSYVAAEAALGSDADESGYRAALASGDTDALARFDTEAEARRQFTLDHLARIDPSRQ